MELSAQNVIGAAISGILGVLWWDIRGIRKEREELKEQIHTERERYAIGMLELEKRVRESIKRLHEKLEAGYISSKTYEDKATIVLTENKRMNVELVSDMKSYVSTEIKELKTIINGLRK